MFKCNLNIIIKIFYGSLYTLIANTQIKMHLPFFILNTAVNLRSHILMVVLWLGWCLSGKQDIMNLKWFVLICCLISQLTIFYCGIFTLYLVAVTKAFCIVMDLEKFKLGVKGVTSILAGWLGAGGKWVPACQCEYCMYHNIIAAKIFFYLPIYFLRDIIYFKHWDKDFILDFFYCKYVLCSTTKAKYNIFSNFFYKVFTEHIWKRLT